jgi:hypothetical protein
MAWHVLVLILQLHGVKSQTIPPSDLCFWNESNHVHGFGGKEASMWRQLCMYCRHILVSFVQLDMESW